MPLERIIFHPLPGTATEADLLYFVERDALCDLIDGTLVEKPVGIWEALIAVNLIAALSTQANRTNAGAVFSPDSTMRMKSCNRVRLPDVSFVSIDRLPKTREPIPTHAPDLAVEVLSLSNTDTEMAQKLIEYFQSGTRPAWIIDPVTRTVAVYHAPSEPTRILNVSENLDGEQVLPGFAMPVVELFRNVPAEDTE